MKGLVTLTTADGEIMVLGAGAVGFLVGATEQHMYEVMESPDEFGVSVAEADEITRWLRRAEKSDPTG